MLKKSIKNQIDSFLSPWLKQRGIEHIPAYTVEEPPKNIDGDLACNIAMLLAKELKTNPRKLAQELQPLLAEILVTAVAQVEIAGAGFLNLRIRDEALHRAVGRILNDELSENNERKAENILIEFVSANPTGPLHIGHGRGAAIGDSLARVYAFLGYPIQREYYLNNVGNQMQMLELSVKLRYDELNGSSIELPENAYKGAYIIDIAKKCKEENSRDFFGVALQEISGSIKKDLNDFSVTFDNWFSEADIAIAPAGRESKVDETSRFLKDKGLAFEQEGALWFASSRFGDDKDRVLKRSDGRYTYLASDVAYHKNKIDRGFTKLIDIWGADHHGYVARMKAVMESLGKSKDDLIVILYQLVSLMREGKPVAMSTRSGEFVTLREVLDEVGKDACRFFFLLRAPDSHLEFDLELAKKKSSENPVFYVQYVHARCHSIFKEALKTISENTIANIHKANPDLSLLRTPEERNLIKKLVFLSDTLELCVRSQSPHHLTGYVMDVADLFHRFYENCRVINMGNEPLTIARLALVRSVANTVKAVLELLGVSAPKTM